MAKKERKKAASGGPIQMAGMARKRRAVVRRYYSEGGLRKWVKDKWVDIGAPKKDGKYQPCGRSKGSKRKYPKCVPLAKATRMTKGQKASAVKRKRAAGNTGRKTKKR